MRTALAEQDPVPDAPIGPTVEQWRRMDEAARDRFYQQIYDAFNATPEAMSEGRPHSRAKSAALDVLTRHFRATGRKIYVADELAVVYPGEPTFNPDLIAVLDVAQPDPDEDERMAWVVAEEGKGPDLILEVHHKGNRDKDLGRDVLEYARVGVHEYFVYDRLHFRLYGFRLPAFGDRYQPLRPRLGRLTSEVLGLDLALVDRRLRFFSGVAELMNSEEFIERLGRMMNDIEARAQEAEALADAAEAQAAEAAAQTRTAEVQAAEAAAQAEAAEAATLQTAREAVLDLAEAYAVDLTPERQAQVAAADAEVLRQLRAALKATRRWPG